MTTSSFLLPASPPSTAFLRRRFFRHSWLSSKIHHRLPQVLNDSTRTEVSIEKSEADKLVDKIDFGELCNEFECTSSPQVESTARQIVRDILEIREGNRAFACYAVSARYKNKLVKTRGNQYQMWKKNKECRGETSISFLNSLDAP